MITYQILKIIFPDSEWVSTGIYITLVFSLLIRVRIDCMELGERFSRHVLFAIFFPVICAICWLIIWPGSLRLLFTGKTVADSTEAKLFRRRHRLKNRRLEKTTDKALIWIRASFCRVDKVFVLQEIETVWKISNVLANTAEKNVWNLVVF